MIKSHFILALPIFSIYLFIFTNRNPVVDPTYERNQILILAFS